MAILIAKKKMLDRVGLSYPTVWQRMREGTFPHPRRPSVGGQERATPGLDKRHTRIAPPAGLWRRAIIGIPFNDLLK